MKSTVKIPAKVNLTLDVFKGENGYHNIKSVVTSINVYDTISISPRKDFSVNVLMKGIKLNCPLEKNNAYITAVKFMERFDTTGVDIVVNKKIPVGAGLGGSSADIAGVIKGMCKLFNVEMGKEVIDFASSLGSDCAYMLNGGYALLSGKGDQVEKLSTNRIFYYIVMPEEKSVSAKECYNMFDKLNIESENKTKLFIDNLLSEKNIFNEIGNDLYIPATEILPLIAQNKEVMCKFSKSFMTGSGSAVLGIFESKKERNKAYKMLCKEYGKRFIKANTIL